MDETIENTKQEQPENKYFKLCEKPLCLDNKISIKDFIGIGFTVSFFISFIWHTLYFLDIHSMPSSTGGLAIWGFISISLFGCLLLFLTFSMVIYPHLLLKGITIHEKRILNIIAYLGIYSVPYFILFTVFKSPGAEKYAVNFVYGAIAILFTLWLIINQRKVIPNIIGYIFFSLITCIFLIIIFDSGISVVKFKEYYVFIMLGVIFLLQILSLFLKMFARHNKKAIPYLMFFLGLVLFFIAFPKFIEGYKLHKIFFVAPYNAFNVGYYKSDIIVNKESYEMIKSMSGADKYEKIDDKSYQVSNAFILFSMGDEYIIKACVTKIKDIESDKLIGDKAKYRQYIIKASKDKDILPSKYSYEYVDWVSSIQDDRMLCK